MVGISQQMKKGNEYFLEYLKAECRSLHRELEWFKRMSVLWLQILFLRYGPCALFFMGIKGVR